MTKPKFISANSRNRSNTARLSSRAEAKRRLRGLLLETLEDRRLLTVGPQLIGVQPNNSDLLVDGSVRNSSPQELTFRFDDSQVIHPESLDGIRITRAGGDGSFEQRTAASDFGTAGEVEIRFTAKDPEATLTVEVSTEDLGTDAAPQVALSGTVVSVVLNNNLATPTTANGLVDVINASTELLPVIEASISAGFGDAAIGATDPQSYSPLTLSSDGDVLLQPGISLVGDAPDDNEVVVRFADPLPNDKYRIEIFGYDDDVQGVVGLRGTDDTGAPGDFFQPTDPNTRQDTIDFNLDLGPKVTSVVPQPVVRAADGSLRQERDTILVYFDDNKLLVENDAAGNPTAQSAENPAFYQLIFTDDTVRNTDDLYFFPSVVDYNASSNTATLKFTQDIDSLPGINAGPRTFRLRVGTRESAPIAPVVSDAAATTITDMNTGGAVNFRFTARELGESGNGIEIVVINSGSGDPPEITAAGKVITVDLGSDTVTAAELLTALQNASASSSLVSVSLEPGSNPSVVLDAPINYSPIQVTGLGSSFDTAGDLGVIGSDVVEQTSLLISSEIDPVHFEADLPGASDDQGHRELPSGAGGSFEQHINDLFGADSVAGITTIYYNFQTIYGSDTSGNPLVNAITAKQQDRAREVMQIWADQVGVQFIETPSQGITIATGSFGALQGSSPDIVIENSISTGVRIDPAFESSLLILESERQWGDNYGEDWFRASLTGVGMLLGLERAQDLPTGTLMRLSTGFINSGNSNANPADEPVFPGTYDVLHGQHIFRPDSNDIDLYRFQVDLGDDSSVGLFVAETFAERLTNSSSLDSLLHLYKQQQAFAESNFAAGSGLNVRFDATAPGRLGNNLQVFVTQSDRGPSAPVLVNVFDNLITLDMNSNSSTPTTAQELIDAVNADPAAAAIVTASLEGGDGTTTIGEREITFSPIVLQDGDVELISRNDDYFSEDSRIELALNSGTYFIGVSASGNDSYDPVIENTGFGGTTQGSYDLRVTFRGQVDTSGAIRNIEGGFVGDEAVVFDGDGDNSPGGTYNFWFQTRPLNRALNFTSGGSAAMDGQIVELVGANGVLRRFEFTTTGFVGIGNIPVNFALGATPGAVASALAAQISSRGELGISATANGAEIILAGDRSVSLTPGLTNIAVEGKTIFVDKSAGPNADGSLDRPFNNISGDGVPNAFDAAQPGDIVRIVGNGGADDDITTVDDNFAYEVGFSLINGAPLSDGSALEVPQGVTTMVDAGAIIKFRRSRIAVGSSSLGVDRSDSALQVLGTPFLTDTAGSYIYAADGDRIPGSVFLTSWLDESIGEDTYAPLTTPAIGDWGGIVYQNDVDASAGRRNLEDEGVFLQYVNHADIRFGGGGNVVIDSVQQVVNPIQILDVRPTITYNSISNSADAAMSAAPNSFEETSFHEPRYQRSGLFTSDYSRIGPEIHHNSLVNNSLDGIFIKVNTLAGQAVEPLSVPARFNDVDITHIVSENIIVDGTPGGALLDDTRPLANLISLQPGVGGEIFPGTYNYKIAFVDEFGYESPPSDASESLILVPGETSVQLLGLPLAAGDFVGRRLYRSSGIGAGQYTLVAELDALSSSFLDTGMDAGGVLERDRADASGVALTELAASGSLDGTFNYRFVMVNAAGSEGLASDPTDDLMVNAGASISLANLPNLQVGAVSVNVYRSTASGSGPYSLVGSYGSGDATFVDNGTGLGTPLSPFTEGTLRPRLDASLVIDPGTVLKLEGSRIELEPGTNLLAEGTDGAPIIFTSKLDDRFGGSGSFDTNGDDAGTTPQPRDWGGIYAAIGSSVSLDHATIAYAGGVTKIEGSFKAFSPIELQQADARITNSTFEFNEDGIGGQGPLNRLGRLNNEGATIFVRGSQPILAGNTFLNNEGSVINIDANSLTADLVGDLGRSTGLINRIDTLDHNRGPLIRDNRMDNNEINGLEIRGDELTVESVWDDTDIVHVLFENVLVSNLHHEGGLRLQSSPSESLVVKLLGYGSNFNLDGGTGLTATGFHTNAEDRVGGTIEILGQPGFPVVMTSYHDDTVGAGLKPDGSQLTDTNNNGIASIPRPSDWRSVLLDQYSNDRNVATVLEIESPTAIAPGFNSTSNTAQLLGNLAGDASNSDENLRLGFVVQGVLSEPADVDVYSFTAEAGTEIWIDVDDTTQSLDMMVELLNASGDLLARSDNSNTETTNPGLITRTSAIEPSLVNPLNQQQGTFRLNADGSFKEDGSINPRDAGLRVLLPGAAGARTTFYFRVRSASTNPEDFNAGLTSGSYEVQVRTRAEQEHPGSTVQYADIRYATNGIHLQGLPGRSPLLGEAQEDESSDTLGFYANNDVNSAFNAENFLGTPGARDQYVGNILDSDRATISIGGELSSAGDLDFYRFDLNYVDQAVGSNDGVPVVFDLDYADGLNRADTNLSVFEVNTVFGTSSYRLVLFAEDSNIADDIRGPLSLTDISDFSRGSVGPKDPYIGAVDLPEGTYAVAVTPSGRIPAALSSGGTRRQPIYSVLNENPGLVEDDDVSTSVFSLAGYTSADLPKLYFDSTASATSTDVLAVDTDGNETLLATVGGNAGQSILDLSDVAGEAELNIVFRNTVAGNIRTISDLSIGFAERGERVLNAPATPAFQGRAVASSSIQTGEYQLEIRQATDSITDTNDRASDSISLIAPAGSDLVDGDTFTLTDAGNEVVFEFNISGSVVPGNVAVNIAADATASEVATAIRDAINDPGVQSRLAVTAAGAGGTETGPLTDARVHLFGRASGSFGKVGVQFHAGFSDQNTNRDQGQVIVQNNFIRHSRDYGIWTEPGQRQLDSRDLIANIEPSFLGGPSESDDVMSNRPATGNTAPGAVRNLLELNNSIIGGFNPGVIIQNNVLESGGLGGVHVAGDNPIWMISPAFLPGFRDNIETQGDHSTGSSTNPIDHFGTFIDDSDYLVIDGLRNRVQFEFEDLAGAGTGGPTWGSGVVGGNGWDDTSVPVYYREDGGGQYLRLPGTTPGYSALEVVQSIRDSVHGSILTTNGTTQTVKATVSASFLPQNSNIGPGPNPGYINYFNRPAVYLEGVSNVTWADNNGPNFNPFDIRRVDAAETPQSFARVINNTVYGNDGRASLDGPGATASEPNDILDDATETWQGTAHNPQSFTESGTITSGDVDLYQFKLDVGERVQIDIDTDTAASNLDSILQIFDATGVAQTLVNSNGVTGIVIDNDIAPGETASLDPYIDFTATEAGVYYVAVSANGNDSFDPLSFAGRQSTATVGAYDLNLMVMHPQNFTITVEDPSQYAAGSQFTIYQVADLPNGNNFRTFEFVGGNVPASSPDIVPIHINYATYRAPDVARAIAAAITASDLNNFQQLSNGNFADASPLEQVTGVALGGASGVEAGLTLFPRRADGLLPTHSSAGIGHDRIASTSLSNTSDARGTTERFVVVENAAWIDGNGVILVDPDLNEDHNLDQLLPETGILVSNGASPTLLNNVFVNVQTPIVNEEAREFANGRPAPFGTNINVHPKPGQVIVGGSVYQFAEPTEADNRLGFGIENGPANLPNTGLDFNFTLGADQKVFVNPQASQFLPAEGSRIIDSSLDSLEEREEFSTVKQAVGIAVSPVLAPARDATGQLRIDDPSVAPPNGQGANVFKDRGALDRADFVGPSAEAVRPLDNDSRGVDQDGAISIIELASGIYPEFRVQLVDGFEVSDPFPGIGIDDSTVVGPGSGLRQPGSAVTLFENGNLLTEGIDYRFTYNTTTNELIFTPLAGVWRNGAVYEIAINNKDRFVVIAPAGDQLSDGDSFTITDSVGGVVYFELDSGFQLQVPQGLSLEIPLAGGAAGGVADGDRFSITVEGVTTTFEFDRNSNSLPGNIPISFEYGDSQQQIANAVFSAIQATGIAVTPRTLSPGEIFVGSPAGTLLDTNFSTIDQPATTAAFKIPDLGPRPGGIVDGQVFTVSDGRRTVSFEYDNDGAVTAGNEAVDFSSALVAEDLATITQDALNNSVLNLSATLVSPTTVHLGLSANGSASSGTSGLSLLGVSRSVSDGDTFTITTLAGSATFEFNSDADITAGNIAIPATLTDTEDEIGARVSDAIANAGLGLNPSHVGGGNVAIGGTVDDQVDVTGSPTLALSGEPGVQTGTRLAILGPLLLNSPLRGAADIIEDSAFTITANGQSRVFEFDSNFSGASQPGNVVISYTALSTQEDIATAIVNAINTSGLGIAVSNQGGGVISLGALQSSQLNLGNTGLTTGRGVVSDGETFTISNDTTTVTFEFENADQGNGFNLGNVPILYSSASTAETLAESMRAAIEGTTLGLSPSTLPGGILALNDTPQFVTDTTAAPTLLKSGVPGGANAVQFIRDVSFTGEDMKRSIIDAINSASNTNLIGKDRGGSTLFVENAVFISPELDSFFLRGVSDLAGNLLRPNRINNETQFTILMPGIALDYGDAPDPFTTTSGRYPTDRVNDGARHVVSETALLGTTITAEADGQPTPAADGDADDGVAFGATLGVAGIFNRNIFTSIDVTLSSPGFVDAWIDFNADGDWDDPGEQILESARFTAIDLSQQFSVTVPATAPVPGSATTTFARFRSSSAGGLIPTGLANDGEVEDYAVTIVPGFPPVAVDDNYTLNEDSSLTTTDADGNGTPSFTIDDGVAANDEDADSSNLQVVVIDPPQNAASFSINDDGTFTYAPNPNFNGTDTFTYRVNDGTLESVNLGTVTITVAEVNDSPVAQDDALTIDEDEVLDIAATELTSNDAPASDNSEDDQELIITAVDSVSTQGGTVTLEQGRVIYTPPTNFSGTDTFVYTVTDNGTTGGVAAPLSTSATVTITVEDKNDAPIAGGDSLITAEDTTGTIAISTLLANDSPGPADEAGQTVVFKSVDPTSTNGGNIVVDGDNIVYTPPADFVGTDTFVYTIEDNGTSGGVPDPAEGQGTVTVTVTPINDDPRVQSAFGEVTMLEDDPTRVIDLSSVFFDPDVATNGDQLTYTIVSNNNATLVTPTVNGSQLELQLFADQNGEAIIEVRATDLAGASITDTLTLTVTPVNDAPRLSEALPDLSVNEDGNNPSLDLSPQYFFDPDVDLNGDTLTFTVISNSNPILVTPIINGDVLSLSLNPNQSGTAVVSVRAVDGSGQEITDTFNLVVNPIDDPPVTTEDSYSVARGETLITTDPQGLIGGPEDDGVLANDSDPEGGNLAAVLVSGPSFASTFALNANGTFTYGHDFAEGQVTDTFTYRASDGNGQSVETTVTITIGDPPPPPHQNPVENLDVNADGFVTPIDALLVVNFLNTNTGDGSVANLPPPPPFRDTNGDNFITAIDALLVINALNNQSGGGGGEGEAFVDYAGAFPVEGIAGNPIEVGRVSDNERIGMRIAERGEMVYGPARQLENEVFGSDQSLMVDTSWFEGEDDGEQPIDAALESLLNEDLL
ncbi:MAG: tandem-95 repeat protein [Pirellulaceae bacterium]